MRADAASGMDRYKADLTGGGACLHAATEAAAEKQRRRRLALQRQTSFMQQTLMVRLKVCQSRFVLVPLLGLKTLYIRP
jgi:hypothetical protein